MSKQNLFDLMRQISKDHKLPFLRGGYDRMGRAIDFWQGLRLFSNPSYVLVALSHVLQIEISTVWIGYSVVPSIIGKRRPPIFETMITHGERSYFRKHDTEQQARNFHDRLVLSLRKGKTIDKALVVV